MGIFHKLRLHEGACIKTEMGLVEIIVLRIGGTKTTREADFEIRGIPDINSLHLSYDSGLVYLVGGLRVGIRDQRRTAGSSVEMHFQTKYAIEFEDYSNEKYSD